MSVIAAPPPSLSLSLRRRQHEHERQRKSMIEEGMSDNDVYHNSGPPLMTQTDHAFLVEVLDRAAVLLRSSPSADRSSALSFLRILAAYDQILLRHDRTPEEDSAFQFLVAMNLDDSDPTTAAATAAAAGEREESKSNNQSNVKDYAYWRRKLDEMFKRSLDRQIVMLSRPSPSPPPPPPPQQQQQQQRQQQRQRTQSPPPPRTATSRTHSSSNGRRRSPEGRELSIESLASTPAASMRASHSRSRAQASRVSFAPAHAPAAARVSDDDLSAALNECDDSSDTAAASAPALSSAAVALPTAAAAAAAPAAATTAAATAAAPPSATASVSKRARSSFAASAVAPAPAPTATHLSSLSAHTHTRTTLDPTEEKALFSLLGGRDGARSAFASAAPPLRQTAQLCFRRWRALCAPRLAFTAAVRARAHAATVETFARCWSYWRRQLLTRRYRRYLQSLLQQHVRSLHRSLFDHWRSLYARRERFRSTQRRVYRASALRQWRLYTQQQMQQQQREYRAQRQRKITACSAALALWRAFIDRRRRQKRLMSSMDRYCSHTLTARSWKGWRFLLHTGERYTRQARAHLLRLRQSQATRAWVSFARARQQPPYTAALTLPQFDALFMWIQSTFGKGYDLLRVLQLMRMRYATAVAAATGAEAPARADADADARPNPHTHPFIAPAATTATAAHTAATTAAFAPTASAPFHSQQQQQQLSLPLAQSLPPSSAVSAFDDSPHYPSSSSSSAAAPVARARSPILGSPSSSLALVPAPYADDSPLHHAVLALLNRCLLFRRHRLPSLLQKIQAWARWYLRRLFLQWRAHVRVQRTQRQQQLAAEEQQRKEEEERECRALVMYNNRSVRACFEKWVEKFHRRTYYSLLTRGFFAHKRARVMQKMYTQWKYAYVAARARRLLRLRRGMRQWKRCQRARRCEMFTAGLITAGKERRVKTEMWERWRLTLLQRREQRRAVLSTLWQRWRAHYSRIQEYKRELVDAEKYRALRVCADAMLLWRSAYADAVLERQYTLKALHLHHRTRTHAAVVWLVNYSRYRRDSRRLRAHGARAYEHKLAVSAVRCWRDHVAARVYRHRQFAACRAGVRNAFLARRALQQWTYCLSVRVRASHVRSLTARSVLLSAFAQWRHRQRLIDLRFETLETHVSLRRDFHTLRALFALWRSAYTAEARAKRLRNHCELVWYYCLVARAFRGWKERAVDMRLQQHRRAQGHADARRLTVGRAGALKQWRAYIRHRRAFSAALTQARAHLQTRFLLRQCWQKWQRAYARMRACERFLHSHAHRQLQLHCWERWSAAFSVVRQRQQRISAVIHRRALRAQQRCFGGWKGWVCASQQRKRALRAAVEKIESSDLSAALKRWRSNLVSLRLQQLAFAHARRQQQTAALQQWHRAFVFRRRVVVDTGKADRRFFLTTTARIVGAWRASMRAEEVHRRFLLIKTAKAWRAHTRRARRQRAAAAEFADTYEQRRKQQLWGRWRAYVYAYRKQRRLFTEARASAVAAARADAVSVFRVWSSARTAARRRCAAVSAVVARRLVAAAMSHWRKLFAMAQWYRRLLRFCDGVYLRSARAGAVRGWLLFSRERHRRKRAAEEIQRRHCALTLARYYRNWRSQQSARRSFFAAAIESLQRPRLQKLWQRWRALAGRRVAVLHLHRSFLAATMRQWRANAIDSRRERVWAPRADGFYARRLRAVAMTHWYTCMRLSRAHRIASAAHTRHILNSLMALWHSRYSQCVAARAFRADWNVRRQRAHVRYAIARWSAFVGARAAVYGAVARVRATTQLHALSHAYHHWRREWRRQAVSSERCNHFYSSVVCRHILAVAYYSWRSAANLRVDSARLYERGREYERQVTLPRLRRTALQQWKDVTSYGVRVRSTASTLSSALTRRDTSSLFYSWYVCARKRVGVARTSVFRERFLLRRALLLWYVLISTERKSEQLEQYSLRQTKRTCIALWLHGLAYARAERAAAAVVATRISAAAAANSDRWARVQRALLPRLRKWMSAHSSVRLCFLLLRRYAAHCRSFRDAEDVADKFYCRRVLTPASFHEWRANTLLARTQRLALSFRRKQAAMRLLFALRQSVARARLHSQQRTTAAEADRAALLRQSMRMWLGEKNAQQQRTTMQIRLLRRRCARVWRASAVGRREDRKKRAVAAAFSLLRIQRSALRQWRMMHAYHVSLLSRALHFSSRLQQWYRARLLSHWLSCYRLRVWRRQRTELLLRAVRTLWQKNAFLAWMEHVRDVRTNRRQFVLSRAFLSWKYTTKRDRERRREQARDRLLLEEQMLAAGRGRRLLPPQAQTVSTYVVVSPPTAAAAAAADEDEQKFLADTFGSRSGSSGAGGRRAGLTPADLDDDAASSSIRSNIRSGSPSPSRSSSSASPVRQQQSTIASQLSLSFPRLSYPDQQWRLTPIRDSPSTLAEAFSPAPAPAPALAALNRSRNASSLPLSAQISPLRVRKEVEAMSASLSARSQLMSSSSSALSAYVDLAASASSAHRTASPAREAAVIAAAMEAGRLSPASSAAAAAAATLDIPSPRKFDTRSPPLSPRSLAQRREDALDAQRRQEELQRSLTPGTSAFVKSLFLR